MAIFDKEEKLRPQDVNNWVTVINNINSYLPEEGDTVAESYTNSIKRMLMGNFVNSDTLIDNPDNINLRITSKRKIKMGESVRIVIKSDINSPQIKIAYNTNQVSILEDSNGDFVQQLKEGEVLDIKYTEENKLVSKNISRIDDKAFIEDVKGLGIQLGEELLSANLHSNTEITNSSTLELKLEPNLNESYVTIFIRARYIADNGNVTKDNIALKINLTTGVVVAKMNSYSIGSGYYYRAITEVVDGDRVMKISITSHNPNPISTSFRVLTKDTIKEFSKHSTPLPNTDIDIIDNRKILSKNMKDINMFDYFEDIEETSFMNTRHYGMTNLSSRLDRQPSLTSISSTLDDGNTILDIYYRDYNTPKAFYIEDGTRIHVANALTFDSNKFRTVQGIDSSTTLKTVYDTITNKITELDSTLAGLNTKQLILETREVSAETFTPEQVFGDTTEHDNKILSLGSIDGAVLDSNEKSFTERYREITGFSGIHNPVFIEGDKFSSRLATGDSDDNISTLYDPFSNTTNLTTLSYDNGTMVYTPKDEGRTGTPALEEGYNLHLDYIPTDSTKFNKRVQVTKIKDGDTSLSLVSKELGNNIYKVMLVGSDLCVVTDNGKFLVFDTITGNTKTTPNTSYVITDAFVLDTGSYKLVLCITKDNKIIGYGKNIGGVFGPSYDIDEIVTEYVEVIGFEGSPIGIKYDINNVVLIHTVLDIGNNLSRNRLYSFGSVEGIKTTSTGDELYTLFGDTSKNISLIYSSISIDIPNIYVDITHREVSAGDTTYYGELITFYTGNGGDIFIVGTYIKNDNTLVETGPAIHPSEIKLGYLLTIDNNYSNFENSLPKDYNSNLYFLDKGKVYFKNKQDSYIRLTSLPEIAEFIVPKSKIGKQTILICKGINRNYYLIRGLKIKEIALPSGRDISTLDYSLTRDTIDIVCQDKYGEIWITNNDVSINNNVELRLVRDLNYIESSDDISIDNLPVNNRMSRETSFPLSLPYETE